MKLRKVKPGHRVLLGVMTWLFITDFVFAQEGVQRLRGLRARQPGLQEAAEALGPPPVPAARAPRQPAEPVAEPGEDVIADLDADAEDMVRLQSEGELPLSKWLEAVETILNMYGVALLEEGDLFTRVVPNKTARNEPMEILAYEDDLVVEDSGELISQMIPLKHIESSEAVAAIKNLHHPYATVTTFDGINSILLTDTAASINRVLQILKYIDVPIEAREEPFVIQILYAKATDIKSKLEQIIAEAQKDQKKSTIPRASLTGPPGVAAPRTPAGVIRARSARRATPTPDVLAEVERGLIRGDVKIIDDERTNLLIIITRPENIPFFEKIIKVLDVETQPDVMVRVFRLEYAEAKDVASMLNDLIGAAKSEVTTTPAPDAAADTGGTALRDYVALREAAKPAAPTAAVAATGKAMSARKSKVGELSQENIKILSDERTNALIIMASRSDIAAMEEIIKDMDTMLLQVMIEVVILEINLDDSLRTGVDWIQRALITYEERSDGLRSSKAAYAGSGGGGDASPLDPLTLVSPTDFASLGANAGLSYYLTLFDLNMDLVFRAVASDSRTRILSSPVIMTTDNKKATIEVTQDQYFFTGNTPIQSGGQITFVEDVQREKIGIKLNVTPRPLLE